MSPQEIPPTIFRDSAAGLKNLTALEALFLTSGSRFGIDEFAKALSERLTATPDPDMALTNLLRFCNTTLSAASLFNDLLQYPAYFELLVELFGQSQYFADILVRDPAVFRWLVSTGALTTPITRRYLTDETIRIDAMFQAQDRKLDALKRLARRETLRIGAQDILGETDLRKATAQLSLIADAMIDAACSMAMVTVEEKLGPRPQTPFAVIGLGKLGGGELNYSSDIDILFVYGIEGESHHTFFSKVSERIVQMLSGHTPEGRLYRVDTRLRPEGNAGPLALPVQGFLEYYESRGELWERQMLIKARAVGGDREFGERFLRQLEPFVYPRTFLSHPADAILRIKARIEESIGDEENIKLMAGGIRDIEFSVQGLQLLHGGKRAELRSGNTLHAIELLTQGSLLTREEAEILRRAYVLFRTVEHRLQMFLNTQTHTLPSSDIDMHTLARRIGLGSGEELRSTLATLCREVRSIFDQVLAIPKAGPLEGTPGVTSVPSILSIIEGGVGEETAQAILAGVGIRDTRQGLRHLRVLLTGSPLTGRRLLDSRTRDAFRTVAPEIFKAIGATPDPDMTLADLSLLAGAQKFPQQMYDALAHEHFRKFIVDICALSPRLTRSLAGHPLLFEMLAADVGALARPEQRRDPPSGDLSEWKQQQELRAAVRHVLGFSTFDDLTREISAIADAVLAHAIAEEVSAATSSTDAAVPPIAVFAVGKFGTRELTFDADLDVMFLSGPGGSREVAENIVLKAMQRLSAFGPSGRLYAIDARLRPDGSAGPLVADLEAFEKYLRTRALVWERQMLTRLRFVSGDAALGDRALRSVRDWVYNSPLPAGWSATIVAMRKKLDTKSIAHEDPLIDVKRGSGGMVDVEFLAQMMLLAAGKAGEAFHARTVPDIIREFPCGVLGADDRAVLEEAYALYRGIEKNIRLTLDERGSLLPEGAKLDTLGRCLGFARGLDLVSITASAMKNTRSIFLRTAAQWT